MHDKTSPDTLATAAPSSTSPAKPRKKLTRGFWLRHLHTWHWISSAVSLVGLLLFVLTGFTLNHAADIAAEPGVVTGSAVLEPELVQRLAALPEEAREPLPADLRGAISDSLATSAEARITLSSAPAEIGPYEIYLAMPRPGGDGWIAIDRETGDAEWELTDRGWISYFNDLHKGRDTGKAWRLFIDVFVLASLVFVGTGFVLLWLHGKHRPSTWPLTGLGLLIPLVLALLFVH